MGHLYVHLCNGDAFQTFIDNRGLLCYMTRKGKKRKVAKNQKVIDIPLEVAKGALNLYLPTASDLFRGNLNSTKDIWKANNRIDKYTGLSQDDTEEITFEALSRVVKEYDDFPQTRAIRVERDHTVEVQMVDFAWRRANNGKVPNTRATTKYIRDSVNHLENLNCTLGALNMIKRSAVQMALRDYENRSGLRQNLLHYGVRRNTTRRICTAFEESANKIADKVQEQGREVYDLFADEMISMIGYMKLD